MPDISMCHGGSCPHKMNCYRYRAIPCEYRQAYFIGTPIEEEDGQCGYFWEIKKGMQLREEESP